MFLVKLILYLLVSVVEMVFTEANFRNASEDLAIHIPSLDKLWFTGLPLNRTKITPLRFAKGANYIYKYREGELLNITCETNENCYKKDFQFFNASSGKVIQLNKTFEEYRNLDGSSVFCSCEITRNETYTIILELKMDKIAKLFFTGLHPNQQIMGPDNVIKYSYKKGEFLNIGCESDPHIETKRFVFHNSISGRSTSRHLFHSRLQEIGAYNLTRSTLHCSYESPEGAYYVIKLELQFNDTRSNRTKKTDRSAFSFTDIIVIVCMGTGLVILLLVFDPRVVLELCSDALVLCKSAWETVALSFAQLGRKLRRKKTHATAVLAEKWTKVVKVQMHAEDASIVPIISIERVRYTEFAGRNASGLSTEYILPVDTKWELPRQNLSFGEVLGEGEFGRVLKAEYTGTADSRLPSIVAVKMLKDEHTDSDMTALVSEMEIMKMIGKHENVVNLLGCCTQEGPLCVVVEYASNGCLREFLNKHNPTCSSDGVSQLNERNLVEFALQVATGMEFLVSRGCIHRDLAARNVLVSEDLTLKIADFGLARDVRDYAYYRKLSAGRLPVRWMAPESLENNYYTECSDIWSFGILFWEIMTFGCTPYRKLPVHFLYDYLKSGKRLGKPDGCQETIYSLMLDCWKFDPEERPRFSELVVRLQGILNGT